MKVAIDKNCINKITDFSEFEYIYIYDDEPLEELLKLNLHCIKKDYIDYVDINLTDYDITCLRQDSIDNVNWKKPPKSKNYKFAIIIPNCNNDHGEYNGKTFLQNCIESVLNQTYQNFELIIVDDMSTDTSVETVEKYVDKRIHLIKNIRKRYNGGSRNVGIEYALNNLEFDYFAFLDSDDWWKDNEVLQIINNELCNHELMLIGLECINEKGVFLTKLHQYNDYKDFFLSDNKVWCTAWARIIRKDKIVYFPEGSLMEDRTWSYEQADNVDLNKVKNLKRVCYVWNRTNKTNSVSITRNKIWEASAWKHIGQQLMFIERLKHTEMKPILEKRIKICIDKIKQNIYEQY
jgi:glycosyltransferase involved in cell wall biosynthesis